MKAWLKGGLIFVLIELVALTSYFFIQSGSILKYPALPFVWMGYLGLMIATTFGNMVISIVLALGVYFAIGALIGWLLGGKK